MFTRKQKKELFEKLGHYLSKRLTSLKESGEYLYKEIGELSGLPLTRVSEIASGKYLSEKGLVGLLTGGIVQIPELIEKCKLNTAEAKFLQENFSIHEDQEMVRLVALLKEKGEDPKQILAARLKEII